MTTDSLRLVMITRLIDPKDPILGFTWDWIESLAKRVKRLYVLTSYVKNIPFKPSNAYFFTWSSNSGSFKRSPRSPLPSRIRRLLSYLKIAFFINLNLLNLHVNLGVDAILAHMNPEFAILAAPFSKLSRTPLILWYLHRRSSIRLVVAHALCDLIVTAHRKGFPIPSPKVKAIGHGVKVPSSHGLESREEGLIISVGRVSRVKRFEELIEAMALISRRRNDVRLVIAGPIYDAKYHQELTEMVNTLRLEGKVVFLGPIPHDEVIKLYRRASILVSCCPALDKAVLEAMMTGTPVIVGDELFNEILGRYLKTCKYALGSPQDLAKKLETLLSSKTLREEVGTYLRSVVLRDHSVDTLASRLISIINNLKKGS